MREFFTVVFNGTVEDLKTNPLFVKSPFGVPEHACNGDVITEVDDLLDLKRTLLTALQGCRDALDSLPVDTYGNIDKHIASADMAIKKARDA